MDIEQGPTIRLAEWNIQSGGFEGYDSVAETPKYLPDIIEGIKQLHAPFVTLIDTYRWDQLYTLEELRHMFGYDHVYCINLEDERLKTLGHNNGITILSNIEVQEFKTIHIQTRNAVKTTLNIQGKPLDIFSVYLDDIREKTRLEQMAALLQHVDPHRKTIITGDFNCISEQDVTVLKKTLETILYNLPQQMKSKFYSVREKLAHRGVIRFLESKDFVDADSNRQSTAPSHKLYPFIPPFLRLDYAFCTPDIVVVSANVLQGKLFDQISDHFPLVVEIEK